MSVCGLNSVVYDFVFLHFFFCFDCIDNTNGTATFDWTVG